MLYTISSLNSLNDVVSVYHKLKFNLLKRSVLIIKISITLHEIWSSRGSSATFNYTSIKGSLDFGLKLRMLLTDGGQAGAGVRRAAAAAAGRRDGSMQPTQYRLLFMLPQMSFVYE